MELLAQGGELYYVLDSHTVPYGWVKSLSLLSLGLVGNEEKVEYHQTYYLYFYRMAVIIFSKATHKPEQVHNITDPWPLHCPTRHIP